jgi:hypothetical protein
MNDQVPTPEADRDPTADGDRALQATRDTRVQFALEAPELFRRLMAIAKNDRHPKQLEAIKLAFAYSLGVPTLRVEARVQSHADLLLRKRWRHGRAQPHADLASAPP